MFYSCTLGTVRNDLSLYSQEVDNKNIFSISSPVAALLFFFLPVNNGNKKKKK